MFCKLRNSIYDFVFLFFDVSSLEQCHAKKNQSWQMYLWAFEFTLVDSVIGKKNLHSQHIS